MTLANRNECERLGCCNPKRVGYKYCATCLLVEAAAGIPMVEMGVPMTKPETVHHPQHYGGADDPFEAIKVIVAWGLCFRLGSVLKYIKRAGKKGDSELEDLKKAHWYLGHKIKELEDKL